MSGEMLRAFNDEYVLDEIVCDVDGVGIALAEVSEKPVPIHKPLSEEKRAELQQIKYQ